MNLVILKGRLTKDPDIRTTQDGKTIARYSLAVDRYKEGADFINCVCFGKTAEFVEKYLSKGMSILINGHIQTGSYEKDGKKIYTTEVVVSAHEFCERKGTVETAPPEASDDGFMKIPDGVTDEELPFN